MDVWGIRTGGGTSYTLSVRRTTFPSVTRPLVLGTTSALGLTP